LTSTYRRNWK